MTERFTIRTRSRRCASPKEGHRQAWEEVQVVEGRRRVVARFDFPEQAQAWIDKQSA